MISMKTEMIEMNKYIVIKTTFVDGELNTENKIFTDKTEAYQYANDVIDEMCKPFEIANESLIEEVQDRYHVIYNDKHTFVASVRIINKEYGKYAYIVREVETHNCNVIESEFVPSLFSNAIVLGSKKCSLPISKLDSAMINRNIFYFYQLIFGNPIMKHLMDMVSLIQHHQVF